MNRDNSHSSTLCTLPGKRACATLLCALGFLRAAMAVDPSTNGLSTEANQARVEALYKAQLEADGQNPNILVWPGLRADRETREVRLLAESTGVGAREIVEFMIVGPGGGHDYESFAVSFALPSDLHRALIFIGMPPGRAVDFTQLAFWPRGERVRVEVRPVDLPAGAEASGVWKEPVRLESLIWRESDGQAMDLSGLVFAGSRWLPSLDGGTQLVYAADVAEPRSIASNYNEPGTVLDVPHQAAQGSVYSSQLMRDIYVLPKYTFLEMTLRPEREAGSPRVQNFTLHVAALKPDARELTDAGFSLSDAKGAPRLSVTNLPAVIQFFADCVDNDQDPFVTLDFAENMPLRLVRRICALLAPLESHKGIRIEPPLAGQLYHKAYSADERHREREGRISQPWELHLHSGDKGITATLIDIEETWEEDAPRPTLTPRPYEMESGQALRQYLDQALKSELRADLALLPEGDARQALMQRLEALRVDELWGQAGEKIYNDATDVMSAQDRYTSLPDKVRRLRVILVYAAGSVSHGQLMSMIEPVCLTHATIHVYLTDAAGDDPKPAKAE